jgi:hypothetical protein
MAPAEIRDDPRSNNKRGRQRPISLEGGCGCRAIHAGHAPGKYLCGGVLFTRIRQQFAFTQHNGLDLRRGAPGNQVAANLSLQMVHEELLSAYRFPRPEDTEKFVVVLRMIQVWLVNHPQDRCNVFLLGNGVTRLRGYSNNGIDQLFQGPQYAQAPGGGARQKTYPGDREVRAATGVSIQLQYLTLHEKNNPANVYATDVPVIAVYIPPEMAQDEIQQAQGGPQS